MMQHTSAALLSLLCCSATPALAQTKTGGPPVVDTIPEEDFPPLTLLEKNKLAKASGSSGLKLGLETRVVGGSQVTQESKYPFFCEWEDAKCGGSLIHDDIVLSAAHVSQGERY